jgi:hypothetical protein
LNAEDSGIRFILFFVKLWAGEQIQKGEHPLQSLFDALPEDCSACVAASHLSKTEQGTTMLNNK